MRHAFHILSANKSSGKRKTRNAVLIPVWLVALLGSALVAPIKAAENGGTVYPAGVETVLPGMVPPPGASMLCEFNDLYESNALADANGHSQVPGFHLRVAAFAVKFTHNWGVRVLGGTLVSYAGLPYLYEHLNGPFGTGFRSGFGNPDIQPLAVAYHRGPWNWWYGFDVFTPGFQYQRNALVNIGQHNFAGAPSAAFTYLSNHATEISSKFQYIVNARNDVTHYRSGNEFVWEYDTMQNLTRSLAVGVNGYYYQQTTDDLQYGLVAGDGNRGRNLAVGPEIRCHAGKFVLVAKYQRDTLVRNKTMGNSFWLQFGVPIGRPHE